MKKIILACLAMSLSIVLTACPRNSTDNDISKIQESVDKIKAKIQEDLSNEKLPESEIQDQESKSPNKDNEPSSAE